MESVWVEGNGNLEGTVKIQGSKNAALPILAATLLIKGKTVLTNCPQITDIIHMVRLLECVGAVVKWDNDRIEVDTTEIHPADFIQSDVVSMRSSIMLLGPMLSRVGEVKLTYPGGCTIGKRPVDLHISALQKLGAVIEEDGNGICASCKKLKGAAVTLPYVSVGVTENLIMMAVLSEGVTRIFPAAREPEIVELCNFLNKAGCQIKGAGSCEIIIKGVKELKNTEYSVMPDRIVAGTYLLAAVGCGCDICLKQVPINEMEAVVKLIRYLGARVETDMLGKCMKLQMKGKPRGVYYIRTNVFPGFPTDLQSSLVVTLLKAERSSVVEETIFENRFQILNQIKKMGATVYKNENKVKIIPVQKLMGAKMEAMELRGGAALISAALMSEGESIINGAGFIKRGYEDIVRDLQCLGAKIKWI